jgi:signal transduction histidine kinase/ligand-binding sensor domain-containing protein
MLFFALTRKFKFYLAACLVGLVLFCDLTSGADFDLAETAATLRIWHHDDALPSDSVTAIVQTRDGFLWVGTTAGLVWFDGVKFTVLRLDPSDPEHPACVTALCEDSNGHLWIGTQQDGLFQLDQGRLKHFSRRQGLLDGGVTSLAADNHGQVWIGGKSGLNLWAGQYFKSFTDADGLSDNLVSGVNVARSGIVWITTRTGMCRFMDGRITPYLFQTESQGRRPEYLGTYEDRRGNLWAFGDTYLINLAEGKRFNYFRSSESASVRIWSLCEGQDGRIWIGTSGRGLFCFQDNHFQPVILGENRWPYDVRAIYEDREGNLWLGTSGGGLVQLRPQSIAVVSEGQGLPNSPPTALALGAGGKIYAGFQRGGLFVGEAGRFERVGGNDGAAVPNFVSSVGVAHDGTVWVGTLGDGLYGLKEGREVHFTTENGLGDDTVLAVCLDTAGGVWASTGAGTIHRLGEPEQLRFDTAQGLPGAPVTAMIAAASGGLWLGSMDGKVLREENGKISGIEGLKNLEGFAVLALHEGEKGRLWIGTSGGGLACLIRGAMINWNTNNGLPNNFIGGVVEDQAENVWLVTGTGIYRVNHQDVDKSIDNPVMPLACKLVSPAKTIPEPTTIAGGPRALLAPDGQLWFASSDGVMNADPHQSENELGHIPLYLESATFNGQAPMALLRGNLWSPDINRRQPFLAPVDSRSLEISFTALNFVAPGELRFRHKLEGFDPDWVDDAGARSVRYGRLTYGHYRFHVAVRNAGGNWQEALETFAFVVPTPFYLQKWAIFLFVLAAVALVAGIVRLVSHRRLRSKLVRLEQQQSLERERMRIARDMHDEMGSKLTKISFLSEHAQVDAAGTGPLADKIESIAQTSRELLQTMDEIVWVVNPRNDTLENLVAYLSHYAVEYFQNTTIECELSLPKEIPGCPLSSELRHNLFLAFEEALNNVLKHAAATKVKVAMDFPALGFEIKIADNGKGFDAAAGLESVPQRRGGGGNGLNNMRQRLRDLGGECLIAGAAGHGTTVTMRIHLNSKNKK